MKVTIQYKLSMFVAFFIQCCIIRFIYIVVWASLVAQRLKCLPPMRETGVRSLGKEDPLEKEMATHSSILAWRIPWMEKPGRLQSTGSQRVRHDFTIHYMWDYNIFLRMYSAEEILWHLKRTVLWPC